MTMKGNWGGDGEAERVERAIGSPCRLINGKDRVKGEKLDRKSPRLQHI